MECDSTWRWRKMSSPRKRGRYRSRSDFLLLAVEEIRHYGAGSLQVSRRLRSMLEDLRSVAPPEYHQTLDDELSTLHDVARLHFPDIRDVDQQTPRGA